MKALSIRQPWAFLIVQGVKTVENRSWSTRFRGEFYIHASQKFDLNARALADVRKAVLSDYGLEIPDNLPSGGILGLATLVDCVTECLDDNDFNWHWPGDYAFLIRHARPVPFIAVNGRLNFWEYAPEKEDSS